ncbi:MAG: hypothetical protein IJ647_04815 [Prevotella sp.]|nr:hypothetical protein [Prevotella sp.]
MKKLFLSLVAAIVAVTATYAQNSLIAVLTHDGDVQAFYGSLALRQAHAAAANGDVITLSSGTFSATNITKAITIRGAGMRADTIAKIMPTILVGDFNINIPDSVTERLTMEGIFHNNTMYYYSTTLKNASFLKCRFEKIDYNTNGKMDGATFIHCDINNHIVLTSSCSASLINCHVTNPYNDNYNTSVFEFVNCVVTLNSNIYYSTFTNCIMFTSRILGSTNNAFYCVGEPDANGNSVFKNLTDNSTNKALEADGTKTLFTENSFYELTSEAKAKYTGTDGTEVGLYGGNLPFDPHTTAPQITKCNVASKSTADGKLSVDIEVQSGE